MWAIYKRELKAYFHCFIGFLFIAVMLFFSGLYFSVYNLYSGYPYFSYVMSAIVFLFMLSVPILCMRILAEERRNKTDQLILTSPVSVGGMVFGKYMALLTILAIPTAVNCLYPLIMSMYGTVPMGEAYLSILGFFLYGAASIAVCMLMSALTESQVIAAVLGFVMLFMAYMMSSICNLISTTGNLLTKILMCYDLYTPFYNLQNGTLNVKSVVYYLSLIGLVLYLTVLSIQRRRYSFSLKNVGFSAFSSGRMALAVAIVVVINIMMGELPVSWTSIDLTSQKLYSLTDQSREFVDAMDRNVTIYVLVAEENQDTILKQTLQRLDDLSECITVEYVNPVVNPQFYLQYTSGSLSSNSLIFESDLRSTVVDYKDIYETETTMDYETYSYQSTTTGYDGEGQIISALDYVTREDMLKIWFTDGHGELSISSSFEKALDKENVDYEKVNLLDYETIPEDTACVILNAPVKDLAADDAKKLTDYLDAGGKVICITGYTQEEMPNLDSVLAHMGMSVADGLILEQDMDHYYRVPYYVWPDMKANMYTSGLYGEFYIFAPYAQAIQIVDEETADITYDAFLTTSESSFVKTSLDNIQDFTKGENDLEGPFNIAVEAVKTVENGQATMVVYGCEQIFTDDASSIVSGANLQLFINTVSSFVEHEVTVSIPVKSYEVSYLTVKQSDLLWWMLSTTILVPLGCLIVGFVIWFRRRKR